MTPQETTGTLLIVEIGSVFLNTLTSRLQSEPYRVVIAPRGKEAERAVRGRKVDVVLLGLDTLKRDGLTLLRRIKKARPFTEVILINTCEQLSLSIEGMKLGAFDDFLVPFDLDAMVRRIREAFARARSAKTRTGKLLRRYEDAMVAAAFAEAGEPDMAKDVLEERRALRSEREDETPE